MKQTKPGCRQMSTAQLMAEILAEEAIRLPTQPSGLRIALLKDELANRQWSLKSNWPQGRRP